MSRKYKIRDQNKLYFLTFAVVGWVDVFTRKEYKDILIDSLEFCQHKKGLELYAFCIMPNHIHLIEGVKEGDSLSAVMRDFKKYTSFAITKAIDANMHESRRDWMLWIFKRNGERNANNTTYQFWQQESHPVELSSNEMIDQKLEYTHQNPVRAGICYAPEDYIYSSAGQYAGKDSVLPVMIIE
jgi:REP element-mobilizing transposase RayT